VVCCEYFVEHCVLKMRECFINSCFKLEAGYQINICFIIVIITNVVDWHW